MRPTDKKSCEVWTGEHWEIWPVSAVYPHREIAHVRCYECHGPVILMNASSNGRNEAHFEHRPAHSECSLVYKYFSGVTKPHPGVVETPQKNGRVSFVDYISDEAAEEIIGNAVGDTEKERLLLARVGQGQFRQKLLKRWGTCSVLGCGPETILVASHIVSWRECETNNERLDHDNGLLLTPNLDKLFDRKMISFSDEGNLLLCRELEQVNAKALGIQPGMRLRSVPKGILSYLARHRGQKDWVEVA